MIDFIPAIRINTDLEALSQWSYPTEDNYYVELKSEFVIYLYLFQIPFSHPFAYFGFLLDLCICNLQFLSFLSFVLLIVHRLWGIILYILITRKNYLKRAKAERSKSESCISHLPSDRMLPQKPSVVVFLTCVNTPRLEYLDDLIIFLRF